MRDNVYEHLETAITELNATIQELLTALTPEVVASVIKNHSNISRDELKAYLTGRSGSGVASSLASGEGRYETR